MSKQWAKEQIHRNELAVGVSKTVSWIESNRTQALAFGGGVLAVTAIVGLFFYQTTKTRRTAWEKLAMAQSIAYQSPEKGLEELKTIADIYSQTEAASHALLSAGDLMYKGGRYKEAREYYQRIIDQPSARQLLPLAMSNLGLAYEGEKDFKKAVEANQRFLDAHQDHFLAPQVHGSLARSLEALGQKDQAKSTYERMSLLYPETYWAQWAKGRLSPS